MFPLVFSFDGPVARSEKPFFFLSDKPANRYLEFSSLHIIIALTAPT